VVICTPKESEGFGCEGQPGESAAVKLFSSVFAAPKSIDGNGTEKMTRSSRKEARNRRSIYELRSSLSGALSLQAKKPTRLETSYFGLGKVNASKIHWHSRSRFSLLRVGTHRALFAFAGHFVRDRSRLLMSVLSLCFHFPLIARRDRCQPWITETQSNTMDVNLNAV
jgi:hypothetical protein